MARGPPRLRNLVPLPSDIYQEIAHCADLPTVAALNRASRQTCEATRLVLYHDIEVLDAAPLLVRTLGSNEALCMMVRSLRFAPTFRECEHIFGPEWNQALIFMINLKHFAVQHFIDMDRHIIGQISFQLDAFTAGGALSKSWFTFLWTQHRIKSLTSLGWPILLLGPVPTTFTHLEHITASPYQITLFLAAYRIKSVRFLVPTVSPVPIHSHTLERFRPLSSTIVKLRILCDQFRIVNEAGQWLLALEELTLDEGEDRWNYCLAGVKSVALDLTINNVPRLLSLRLVSRDLIYSGRRHILAAAIRERCDLTTLRIFTLCSTQGCSKWCAWGTAEETVEINHDCGLAIDL